MRRIVPFLFLLLMAFGANAQISVKSFQALPTDMTASSLEGKRIDQNNEPAALIRVVTSETGFVFEAGALGIVETKQKVGEIWVWVPRGSRKISIMHQQRGVMREYRYPIELEAERTYEMVLTTAKVETIVKEVVREQYLMFKITPPNAVLEVNDQDWEVDRDGTAMRFVGFGTYSYRVQAPNYHPDAGRVTVDDPNNTQVVQINLNPNFGYIQVTGTGNLSGANVYIDNALIGKAPCKSEALKSGKYNVRITKELYDTYNETITVKDNETTTLSPTLSANYAEITLTVDSDAEIWVNDTKKGTRSWTGSLGSGTYKIECKQTSHETSMTTQEITPNMSGQTITLPKPTPIYGSLNVESTPLMAKIYIDGKEMGATPKFIPEVLIGQHNLRLSMDGYNDYTEAININKDERKQVKATLNKNQAAQTNNEIASTTTNNVSTTPNGIITALISDDFNSNSINTQYWKATGNVKVRNGQLTISQSQTDKEMSLKTHMLSMPASNKIVVERKFYAHKAKNYFYGGFEVWLNGNKDNRIYISDMCCDYVKFYGSMVGCRWVGDKDDTRIRLCDAFYDRWVNDKTIIDFVTGSVSYYIDNSLIATKTVPGLSSKNASSFVINFHSYGWWTGHYMNYDYIRIGSYEGATPIPSQSSSSNKFASISDDFNENSINSGYWKTSGDVKVRNGILTISQSQTDKDMSLRTHMLSMPASKKIVVERKFYAHKAKNYFYGGFEVWLNGNKDNRVYISDMCCDYVKFYGSMVGCRWAGDKDDTRIRFCDAYYDRWVNDKTIIDFATGTVSYYIDNNLIATKTVPGLSSKNASTFVINFHSYGWWTGHYMNYDYIRISDTN